jgi:hypothetical protein
MSNQSSFPITTFQDISGEPIAKGSLLISLSKDVATPSGGQLGAGNKVTVPLNDDGVVAGSPVFWENSALTPPDSIYIVRVYESNNELVSNQINVTVGNSPGAAGFGTSFGTSFGS